MKEIKNENRRQKEKQGKKSSLKGRYVSDTRQHRRKRKTARLEET
jgi:hypothetical protein